jgi:hypothetical protein
VPSVVGAVKDYTARREAFADRLAGLQRTPGLAKLDPAIVVERARAKMGEWRGLLGRQTAFTRQMLRKLLVGRVTLTPEGRQTTITGVGTLEKLFGGVLVPKGVASPTGTAIMWYVDLLGIVRRAA